MKLVRESLIEGVGDKYAERKWGIPDEEKTAEREYLSGTSKEGETVVSFAPSRRGDGTHKVKIIANPGTLKGLDSRVRGVIDRDGNYYTETVAGMLIHHDIIRSLLEVRVLAPPILGTRPDGQPIYPKNPIAMVSDWHKMDPNQLGFITVQRWRDTNEVWIGESNILVHPRDSWFYSSIISDQRRWMPVFRSFMKKAQKKNPGIDFVPKLLEDM